MEKQKSKLGRKPAEDKKIPVVIYINGSFFAPLGCTGELPDKKRKMAERLYRFAEQEVKKKKVKAIKKAEAAQNPETSGG